MSQTDELKPCPFCGSTDLDIDRDFVKCDRCGVYGPDRTKGDKPHQSWNRRASATPELDPLVELLGRLRNAVDGTTDFWSANEFCDCANTLETYLRESGYKPAEPSVWRQSDKEVGL